MPYMLPNTQYTVRVPQNDYFPLKVTHDHTTVAYDPLFTCQLVDPQSSMLRLSPLRPVLTRQAP